MKRPRLNALRVFEAAGRRLSFSLAAKDLNVSQAAVSQQIRHLEAYLGAALFLRHHRNLSLTSTGKTYLAAVHETLDRLDTVTDQLFPDRSQQTVTIRCTSSVATLWLAPQLGKFQQNNPNIDLRIRTLDQDGSKPVGSELEIIIQNDSSIDADTRKLLVSTITPVCASALLENQSRQKRPIDILHHRLIHVIGYEDDWHRWFRCHQMNEIEVPGGLSVDGSLIAIESCLRGDGIMLGRRPFIDHYLESGELVEVFSEPYYLHADYYLRQRSAGLSPRGTKVVTNWLIKLADGDPASA